MDPDQLTREQAQAIWDEENRIDAGLEPKHDAGTEQTSTDGEAAAAAQDQAPVNAAANTDAAAEADPWAGMSQAARDYVLGLEQTIKQATQRLRNAEGHIGGLTSQLKQLSSAAQRVDAAGGDAPSAQQIAAAQGSASAMQRLKTEYPEFGAAIDEALREQLASIPKVEAPKDVVTRAELEEFRAITTVEAAHPGWRDRVQTPSFQGWLSQQPVEVQQLAASDSPQHAIRLLDIHRDAMARRPDQDLRNNRLASAAAIPSGRSQSARAKNEDQMTDKEYWAYLNRLEKSQ